jgi:hypothetical protein
MVLSSKFRDGMPFLARAAIFLAAGESPPNQ